YKLRRKDEGKDEGLRRDRRSAQRRTTAWRRVWKRAGSRNWLVGADDRYVVGHEWQHDRIHADMRSGRRSDGGGVVEIDRGVFVVEAGAWRVRELMRRPVLVNDGLQPSTGTPDHMQVRRRQQRACCHHHRDRKRNQRTKTPYH